MPTHSLLTPADEYLSSLVRHFRNILLLNAKARPPTDAIYYSNQQIIIFRIMPYKVEDISLDNLEKTDWISGY